VVGVSVVTFNYDTLIEHTGRLPIWPMSDQWPNVAFRLHKVHGSTNWWRARGGGLASEIDILPLIPGWGPPEVQRDPRGDERVLVPPIATKAEFYELSAIRRAWREARTSLEKATRLYIVGYRLPDTDLAASALIGEYLNPKAEIVLVNSHPTIPEAALNKMGRPPSVILDGDDSIKSKLVPQYEAVIGGELATEFNNNIRNLPNDLPLLARMTNPTRNRAITKVISEPGRLILQASDSDNYGGERSWARRVGDLRDHLTQAAADHVPLFVRVGSDDHLGLGFAPGDYNQQWLAVEA
jgi:hypothetical protein